MIVKAARGAAAAICLTGALFSSAHAQLVQIRDDRTAGTTAIELWFRVPSSGFDLKSPGIARLALAAAAASRPAGGGSSLSEIVTRLGGSLSLEVYPDISMVGASVPATSASSVLAAMRAAYFTPAITAAGMKAAAADSAIAAAQQPFDSARLLQDALFAQLFSAGPAHYAPIPDAGAFANISQSDVQAFAARGFAAQNAIYSLAGNVGGLMTQNTTVALANPPLDSTRAPAPAETNVSARVTGLGLGWTGPPISDTRAATAMDFVADYLFDPDRGVVSQALRSQPDVFANGQFVTLHDPGVLLVTVAGPKAASVQQNVLDAVSSLQRPLDAAAFAAARQAFLYHILSQTQTPVQRADNAGWYAAEGNAQYAPGDASGIYLQAASSLDPAFVAQTVRTYLQHPAIVHLIQSSGGAAT